MNKILPRPMRQGTIIHKSSDSQHEALCTFKCEEPWFLRILTCLLIIVEFCCSQSINHGLRKCGGLYLIPKTLKISCSVLEATKTPYGRSRSWSQAQIEVCASTHLCCLPILLVSDCALVESPLIQAISYWFERQRVSDATFSVNRRKNYPFLLANL